MSLRRLLKSLAWRAFPSTDLQMKLSSGLRLHLRSRSDVVVLQEIFIEKQYSKLIEPLPEITAWVDLGCNAGLFSLYMENWARERGWSGPRRALLVDPHRGALASAQASLASSGLSDTFIVKEGAVAGAREGQISFSENTTAYRAGLFGDERRQKRREVPILDLGAAINALGARPQLLKVDIEGAEKLLFDFWAETVKRFDYLIVEWHEPHMSGRQLDARCLELGFACAVLERLSCYHDNPAEAIDLPIGFGLWKKQGL